MANERVCVWIFVVSTFLFTGCTSQCYFYNRPKPMNVSQYYQVYIMSPRDISDPNLYPPNANCAWRIIGPSHSVIKLVVHSIDMEENHDCVYDAITLYDGYDKTSRVLAKFCDDQHIIYSSTGRHLYINFTSDGSGQKEGFMLLITAVHEDSAPTTTRPEWPWDFTSRRPLMRPTTPSTDRNNWRNTFNTTALVAGLAGGCILLFLIVGLCRYCHKRNLQYPRGPSQQTTRLGSGAAPGYPHDSSVFMTSGGNMPSAPYGAHTNMGFSTVSELPPSYESVQMAGPPTAPASSCLPSYSDVLMMSSNQDTPKPE